MLTLLLALTIATTPGHHATTAHDIWTMAHACATEAPPHGLDPALLCAVAWVESRWSYRATNGHHCGAWQQSPAWSAMWGDDCWDGSTLLCRQPGGAGVDCEELMDVPTAARVAARHLAYLSARYDRPLCRYSGSTGINCERYEGAVERVRGLL